MTRRRRIFAAFWSALLSACAVAPPAAAPGRPVRDFLIVPGIRMGPVRLGETEAQLRRSVGAPAYSPPTDGAVKLLRYSSLGLNVYIYKDRVYKIGTDSVLTSGRRYATLEGATIGIEKQDLVATLGDPLWTQLVTPRWEVDCYPDEVEFKVWVAAGPGKHHVFSIAIGACDDTTP